MRTAPAFALVLAFSLASQTPAFAQQERGDLELQFAGSLLSTVGRDDASITTGLLQAKLGVFVTDRVEVGGFPTLVYERRGGDADWVGDRASDTRFGLGLFASYSFLMEDATTVPYLGVQAYRIDLTDSDETGWLGVNGGLKFFFSRRTAFDAGGNVLLGLGDEGGALILFQVGLSFLL